MRVAAAIAVAVGLLGAFVCFRWYDSRSTRIVLYSHGTLEVPSNRLFSIFNPFRDRTSEHTAERLIRDLQTDRCDQIVRKIDVVRGYDPRVCTVIGHASDYSLVWREDGQSAKELVYYIPQQRATMWIGFKREEGGYQIYSVSVVR